MTIEFDVNLHGDSLQFECDALSTASQSMVGTEAHCLWTNHRKMVVMMGNDQQLLGQYAANGFEPLLSFKPNLIASSVDADIVQTDGHCLNATIEFVNGRNLDIEAVIDGVTGRLIVLYCVIREL